jgi:hypothetical protein
MVNPYRLNIAPRVLHSEKLPRAVTADTFCDCSPSDEQLFHNRVREELPTIREFIGQPSSRQRYFSSPYTSTSPLAPKYTRPLATTGITNRVAMAARSRLLFCSDV